MTYRVYEDRELIFETTNEDLAFQMACNINEDGGNAYVESDGEEF